MKRFLAVLFTAALSLVIVSGADATAYRLKSAGQVSFRHIGSFASFANPNAKRLSVVGDTSYVDSTYQVIRNGTGIVDTSTAIILPPDAMLPAIGDSMPAFVLVAHVWKDGGNGKAFPANLVGGALAATGESLYVAVDLGDNFGYDPLQGTYGSWIAPTAWPQPNSQIVGGAIDFGAFVVRQGGLSSFQSAANWTTTAPVTTFYSPTIPAMKAFRVRLFGDTGGNTSTRYVTIEVLYPAVTTQQ